MRKDNVRVFFPVGMGGFSFERMDETTIVYDCGSTSAKVIKENVKALKADFFGAKDRVIDHLFISHFDLDHRNGVETLLSLFDVKEIHLPYIDYKYRAVLNMMTHNGVANIFATFIQHGAGSWFSFYQMNSTTAHSIRSKNGKWEWVITNLLNESYFDKALDALKDCGIGFGEHPVGDPLEELVIVGGDKIEEVPLQGEYTQKNQRERETKMAFYTISDRNIRSNTDAILLLKVALPSFKFMTVSDKLKNANGKVPDIVSDIEKNEGYAKNEYGMIMLSKPVDKAQTTALYFKHQDIRHWWPYHYYDNSELTSCLYTGDMCMNRDADLGTVLSFITYNNEPLQFFQIPHHGSAHNSSLCRLQYIDTRLYFCYDNNCRRLVNNFGQALMRNNPFTSPLDVLLIDRDSEMDEAVCIY